MNGFKLVKIAAIFGCVAVILGAFGAHTLKNILLPEQLAGWNTAVEYQFYHSILLLVLGLFSAQNPSWNFRLTAALIVVGICLFSGSIYLLSFKNQLNFGGFIRIIGISTPIGGTFFIAGWLSLLLNGWRKSA